MHEVGGGVMRLLCGILLPAAMLGGALALEGCTGVAQAGPAPGVAPGYGYTCHAGAYICRLPEQVPQGSQCSCPGLGAPSYGRVR